MLHITHPTISIATISIMTTGVVSENVCRISFFCVHHRILGFLIQQNWGECITSILENDQEYNNTLKYETTSNV